MVMPLIEEKVRKVHMATLILALQHAVDLEFLP